MSGALALASTGALVMALTVPVTPVHAIVVFDPSNYAQNVLTAARTLQQINQQMQSLQNEAAMLTGMAKNLTKIDFPELQQLTQKLQQIDRLMRQAQGVDFDIDRVDDQFRTLFRTNFEQALRSDQRVMGARSRLDTAMAAFRQTMTVQAQVVGNVREDATALAAIVAKSQGAEGGLQAQQATNQLLALTAKQQFQIQSLMAAQYRAEAIEQARRVQAEAEARTATKQFLGSGKAYTPD
ncbi:P-type conjugative transfer protein TrbJ [Sphingobium boeckii]|uniref:P-type conjugative transfer protein TrbJ n=2 Tax=Sphingobium boeckii TaxID=1082345 RepID=A0A7W9AL22_9SPHN|nr:P-type conjugative transfer protein TrbJ [Sphingobium boeckii]